MGLFEGHASLPSASLHVMITATFSSLLHISDIENEVIGLFIIHMWNYGAIDDVYEVEVRVKLGM